MRGLTTTLLAAMLALSLEKPGFADVIVSSTDPNINSSIHPTGFIVLRGQHVAAGWNSR